MNISVLLCQPWAELGLKSGLIGNLSMDDNPHEKKEDFVIEACILVSVMFFIINRAWIMQTEMGQFQC